MVNVLEIENFHKVSPRSQTENNALVTLMRTSNVDLALVNLSSSLEWPSP